MKKSSLSLLILVLTTAFSHAQYINTLAGNGTLGFVDGGGTNARFYYPSAVALDASGNIYVAGNYDHSIRKITPAGVVTTLAGNGTAGYADGTGAAAQFQNPYGLTVASNGDVYVADAGNHRIRKITPLGVVTTVAGSGIWGILDGTLANARFYNPSSVAIDNTTGLLYVTDFSGNDVRKVDIAGNAVSLLAGNPGLGNNQYADGTGTAALFYHPTCIIIGPDGNLYVADEDNHCIRKIDKSTGAVTTIAGIGKNSGSTDGPLGTNKFNYPRAMAFDASGNMYVAGYIGGNIRKMDLSGYVTTFAGTGAIGYVDAVYASAQFYYPGGIAVNSAGTIYISDNYNHTIRVTGDRPMPVAFGEVSASISKGSLQVSWISLSENNNTGYDIEASADGVNFTKIGSQLSKAKDGNSSSPQEYNFSTPFKTAVQGLALLFGFLAFGFRKRSRLLALGLVAFGLSIFAISCQKNSQERIEFAQNQLFIRIKQIDKNGTANYSKIVQAVEK